MLTFGVSAYEFGSKVTLGDSDIGNLLYNVAPSVGYWDVGINPGVYDGGDIVYLSMDGDNVVDAGDVRLTPFDSIAAGTKVAPADNDIGKTLTLWPGATICYMELDSSPGYDLGDTVYLRITGTGAAPTEPNDIRLTKVNGLDAGTRVMDFHGDNNMPVTTMLDTWGTLPIAHGPMASIRFFNANGNYDAAGAPIYDNPDTVYLDLSIPGSIQWGSVTVNDLRLSV
jgi:hypothetical protein